MAGPQIFTAEAWIKTTTTSGGKILGFGNSAQTGTSGSNYDRHLYMDNARQAALRHLRRRHQDRQQPPTSYNDGQWHQVVGTLGPDGMTLYVDGVKVASDPTVDQAQPTAATGGSAATTWPPGPASRPARNFNGTIDEVSIYPTALTDAAGGSTSARRPAAGRRTSPRRPPSPRPAPFLDGDFDGSTSTDSDGTDRVLRLGLR